LSEAMSASSLSAESNTNSSSRHNLDVNLNASINNYKLVYYYSSNNLMPDTLASESTKQHTKQNTINIDGKHLALIEQFTSSVEKFDKSLLLDFKVSFNKKINFKQVFVVVKFRFIYM
jgi:hypothetical protein